MSKFWHDQGCQYCRGLWEKGLTPPEIFVDYEGHQRLHKCDKCESYWVQYERYASAVTPEEARASFPMVFKDEK
ncbi:hypothetical protein [Thalassolituus marinus]|uniref:Uncharacterized protein n=1 Tax=Thalassolituus marinus TaxID=671053 RepID=A0ABS7ZPP6_9GAMM|nr:hypothetical protein [Thalassolituus marinus]MCA6063704.1 hypothetical protein [Thalassolituus marinus]